jgi:hypothetical protein
MSGLGVFCEDDHDELHRRHNAIKAHLGIIGATMEKTWVWPRVGFNNLLVTFTADGKPTMSPFFEEVRQQVIENKVELLILDTAADLYGGNEVIRGQVNFFIKSVCGGFIREARAAGWTLTVLLLAHPSQAGRSSGSGESGSTGWNNAVRARLYLTRPEDGHRDEHVLTRKKSNYSASGDDVAINLLWSKGVLTIPGDSIPEAVFKAEVAKCESYIKTSVDNAWRTGQPYKARARHPRELTARLLDDCKVLAVSEDAMKAALSNLKRMGAIFAERAGRRRGWRVDVD